MIVSAEGRGLELQHNSKKVTVQVMLFREDEQDQKVS